MNEPQRPPTPPLGPPDPDGGHPRLETAAMWSVVSYLISGPATFGGIGWALDRWLGTGFFMPAGILGGMAVSLYLVWVRYGTQQRPPEETS